MAQLATTRPMCYACNSKDQQQETVQTVFFMVAQIPVYAVAFTILKPLHNFVDNDIIYEVDIHFRADNNLEDTGDNPEHNGLTEFGEVPYAIL